MSDSDNQNFMSPDNKNSEGVASSTTLTSNKESKRSRSAAAIGAIRDSFGRFNEYVNEEAGFGLKKFVASVGNAGKGYLDGAIYGFSDRYEASSLEITGEERLAGETHNLFKGLGVGLTHPLGAFSRGCFAGVLPNSKIDGSGLSYFKSSKYNKLTKFYGFGSFATGFGISFVTSALAQTVYGGFAGVFLGARDGLLYHKKSKTLSSIKKAHKEAAYFMGAPIFLGSVVPSMVTFVPRALGEIAAGLFVGSVQGVIDGVSRVIAPDLKGFEFEENNKSTWPIYYKAKKIGAVTPRWAGYSAGGFVAGLFDGAANLGTAFNGNNQSLAYSIFAGSNYYMGYGIGSMFYGLSKLAEAILKKLKDGREALYFGLKYGLKGNNNEYTPNSVHKKLMFALGVGLTHGYRAAFDGLRAFLKWDNLTPKDVVSYFHNDKFNKPTKFYGIAAFISTLPISATLRAVAETVTGLYRAVVGSILTGAGLFESINAATFGVRWDTFKSIVDYSFTKGRYIEGVLTASLGFLPFLTSSLLKGFIDNPLKCIKEAFHWGVVIPFEFSAVLFIGLPIASGFKSMSAVNRLLGNGLLGLIGGAATGLGLLLTMPVTAPLNTLGWIIYGMVRKDPELADGADQTEDKAISTCLSAAWKKARGGESLKNGKVSSLHFITRFAVAKDEEIVRKAIAAHNSGEIEKTISFDSNVKGVTPLGEVDNVALYWDSNMDKLFAVSSQCQNNQASTTSNEETPLLRKITKPKYNSYIDVAPCCNIPVANN